MEERGTHRCQVITIAVRSLCLIVLQLEKHLINGLSKKVLNNHAKY